MGKNTWFLKLAAILCVILFLAGCGSDDYGSRLPEKLIDDPQPGTGPQIWYVSSEGGEGSGISHLYTIDPVTYDTVDVGPIRNASSGAAIHITDLATSPGGVLFGCSYTHLYRINAQTAAATLVGPTLFSSVVSLDFDPEGFLYGATKDGKVLNISPNDGWGDFLFSLSDGYGSSGDLVFAPDGTLYASLSQPEVENDAVAVIAMKMEPPQIRVIGDSGAVDIFGLSFYEGQLYGFTAWNPSTAGGALWTIDQETGEATLVADLPFQASGTN